MGDFGQEAHVFTNRILMLFTSATGLLDNPANIRL